jgi:hypothetical protein
MAAIDALILITLAILLIGVSVLVHYFNRWFPVTDKFRITKKQIGNLSFYRPELHRKFFGWTPFYASRSNGHIYVDESWTYDESDCQKCIDTYKQLKPIE